MEATSTERARLLDVARRAAALGAGVVRASYRTNGAGDASPKGRPGDWVTDVDVASESAIRAFLETETPSIPVVGEEAGGTRAHRHWLVDPLDGTTNFVHGFRVVGVSVALMESGIPVAGAVAAPLLGETYWASAGGGAWADRGAGPEPLAVAGREPGRAVVATGFPFRRHDLLPGYFRTMEGALRRFEDLRRPGSASLDLAWVAAGVFDGFFELALSSWDVAAGGLLIREAGGVVTDWDGGPAWLSGNILAGSPAVHSELVQLAELRTANEGDDPPPSIEAAPSDEV